MVEVGYVSDLLKGLVEGVRGCFARVEPWIQAGKYIRACLSELPKRNGWSIAEWVGDARPDKTQRLLNHASWDTAGVMSATRRFLVAGLDWVAGRRGLRIAALDETGQQKTGTATAGVKRQYMGCAGRVANGINTVHLSYVRQQVGHGLIGFRQWIPREQITDPAARRRMGLPEDLGFATKGELAVQILTDAYADGMRLDFVCGDEVYGACPTLRSYLEERGQGYVLRVAKTFMVTLCADIRLTCAEVVSAHLKADRRWQVVSAGAGSKGKRDYAWAWVATDQPRHWLLIRRHLKTGECAYHYCHIPAGQPVSLKRLVTAAGLRWPVEEDFTFGKDYFGLDQSQVRLHIAITRHTVLVAAALAVCAIAAAQARRRTDSQAPPPTSPNSPPAEPGMIPLTVAEIKRLFNAATTPARSLWHAARWSQWRRRHQARARWYHKRARLARQPELAQVKP